MVINEMIAETVFWTLGTSLSILAIAMAVIIPLVTMFWSFRFNTRLQERMTRENDILREQVEKSVLRPLPFVDVLFDTSASLQIHPRNFGNGVAHDFTINVRYPSESKITVIESEYFEIKEGGIGEDFVKFFREVVPAETIIPTIVIDAEKDGKAILTRDVSFVCLEQKAMISLPPYHE